jgi:hypothetical protein
MGLPAFPTPILASLGFKNIHVARPAVANAVIGAEEGLVPWERGALRCCRSKDRCGRLALVLECRQMQVADAGEYSLSSQFHCQLIDFIPRKSRLINSSPLMCWGCLD